MASEERLAGLAGTYAEALFQVAEEQGVAEQVLAELEAIVALGDEHPAFRQALLSPLAAPSQRAEAVERAFRGRVSDVLVDFYQVLSRRGRPELLRAIAKAYRAVLQRERRILDVRVASAVPLDEALRERIGKAVRDRTGFTARLIESVDPALIGGLVLRLRDWKFDSTMKRSLERLHAALLERASNEIIRGAGSAPEGNA